MIFVVALHVAVSIDAQEPRYNVWSEPRVRHTHTPGPSVQSVCAANQR